MRRIWDQNIFVLIERIQKIFQPKEYVFYSVFIKYVIIRKFTIQELILKSELDIPESHNVIMMFCDLLIHIG